jgi:16S rRNA (adenine1518-N6/adenine1519-N6)-dimethyltransferase
LIPASAVTDHPRRPRKRFGQHFLEPSWVKKVVEAIGPLRGQALVEIGPGRGALTFPLLAAGAHVAAFEIDRDLVSELERAGASNLRVVQGDFLTANVSDVVEALRQSGGHGIVRVVGNLPYHVASPILVRLAELYRTELPIEDATLMIQREVAARVAASPGSHEYGVLTVLVQRVADVSVLLQLPAGAFRPRPSVLSTLVRLRFHPPTPTVLDETVFSAVTRAMFTRRRKTLGNALRAYAPPMGPSPLTALKRAEIDPRRRPETLSLGELGRLADAYVVWNG